MTEHLNNEQWSAPASSTMAGSIDPVLQARLDRLAQRNAAPPFAASAASQTQPAGRPTSPSPRADGRTPAAKPGRRHAAKGSRKAALAISLGATGALSVLFASLNTGVPMAMSTLSAEATNETAGSPDAIVETSADASARVDTTAAIASSPTNAATTVTTAARVATSGTAATTATTAGRTATTVASSAATTPKATTATTVATIATKSAATSTLAAGTYTGSSISTKWGPVQVAITVAAGKITEVTTVAVPSDDRKSVQINNRATPVLRSEALTAQSSAIANVSGATYTSNGYAKSLQAAIDKARTAASTANAA